MENLKQQETNINVAMDMNAFEGVTAQMFRVFSIDTESRLDCIYVDQEAVLQGSGETTGKVVARINMSTQRLMELRDVLNQHFEDLSTKN